MNNTSKIDIRYRIIFYISFCAVMSSINLNILFKYYNWYAFFFLVFIFVPVSLLSLILFSYDDIVDDKTDVNKFQIFVSIPVLSYIIIGFLLFSYVDDKLFFSNGPGRYFLFYYYIFTSSLIPISIRSNRRLNRKNISILLIFIFPMIFYSKEFFDSFFYAEEVSKNITGRKLVGIFGAENSVSINIILFSIGIVFFALSLQVILDYAFFGGRSRFSAGNMESRKSHQ